VTGLEVRILLHHWYSVKPIEQASLFQDLLGYEVRQSSAENHTGSLKYFLEQTQLCRILHQIAR